MADTPKRWVITKMLHAAVQRTEEEIAELKAGGLFARDASGPDDTQAAAPAAPTPPAGSPPPGVKPDDKEKM